MILNGDIEQEFCMGILYEVFKWGFQMGILNEDFKWDFKWGF